MLQAGTHAAVNRRHDGSPAIIRDQTIAVAGIDQALDHLSPVEFAAGDELK